MSGQKETRQKNKSEKGKEVKRRKAKHKIPKFNTYKIKFFYLLGDHGPPSAPFCSPLIMNFHSLISKQNKKYILFNYYSNSMYFFYFNKFLICYY